MSEHSFLLPDSNSKVQNFHGYLFLTQKQSLTAMIFLFSSFLCLEFLLFITDFLMHRHQIDWLQLAKYLVNLINLLGLIILRYRIAYKPSRVKNYLIFVLSWTLLLTEIGFEYPNALAEDNPKIAIITSLSIMAFKFIIIQIMFISLPVKELLKLSPLMIMSILGLLSLVVDTSTATAIKFFLEVAICFAGLGILMLLLLRRNEFLCKVITTNLEEMIFLKAVIKSVPIGLLLTDKNYDVLYQNSQMQNYLDSLPADMKNPQTLFRQLRGAEVPQEDIVTIIKDALCQRYEGFPSPNVAEVCLEDVLDIMFKNFKIMENVLRGTNTQDTSMLPSSIKFNMRYMNKVIEVQVFPMKVETRNCALLLFMEHNEQYEKVGTLFNEEDSNSQALLLSSISHELRTPLNSALALIQASIQEPSLPKELKDNFLIPGLSSMQILSYSIKDILDYKKANSGTLGLRLETCNVASIIKKTIKLVELQARKKNIAIFSKISPNIPAAWSTDADRVCQILLNLLSNGLKYTMKGYIVISASYLQRRGLIKIKVADTGIGMEKSDLTRLQKAFKEQEILSKKLNLHSTGINLGLTVSNQICAILGQPKYDYLKVKSSADKGSEFKFYLENKTKANLTSLENPQSIVETHESLLTEGGNLKRIPLKKSTNFSQNRFSTRKESVFSPHRSPKWDKMSLSKDIGVDEKQDESLDNSSDSSPSLYANTSLLINQYSSIENNKANFGSSLTTRMPKIPRQCSVLRDMKSMWQDLAKSIKIEKVLIVDDDSFNILSLELIFKKLKLKCDHAYNGRQAIDMVMNNKYDLIMMDCNMPVMDGWEATKEILSLIAAKTIDDLIIVACTAFDDAENLMRCGEAGMKYIIQKPVNQDKLADLLKKLSK